MNTFVYQINTNIIHSITEVKEKLLGEGDIVFIGILLLTFLVHFLWRGVYNVLRYPESIL
jgi:hypothetical protein